ncbi:MAG: hypothetical protein FWG74_08925, partial [Planctomycetes bacterium]|nr:hypothetical protein [Planctomycetota bacterium]
MSCAVRKITISRREQYITFRPVGRRSFSALLVFAACFLLALPGCGDSEPSQPDNLVFSEQPILAGPLNKPLERELRFILSGSGREGGRKQPVPGRRVTFKIIAQPDGASGAVFSPDETITDAGGLAAVRFIVGDKPGIYRLEASLPDYPGLRPAEITVLGGVKVEGGGQDGWIGWSTVRNLAVTIESAPGKPPEEGKGQIRFGLMNAPAGAGLSSDLRRTDENGRADTEVRFGERQGPIAVGITIISGIPGNTAQLEPIRSHFFAIDVYSVGVTLLGGLALFLFGMRMMSESLQFVAGDKLRDLLNFLTTNRFMSVGIGAAVTSIIQSSSACTVMVVGFVNAGLMRLE